MNRETEKRLVETVEEHDYLLRGNGDRDGLVHSVRMLMEDRKERKRIQVAILTAVIALVVERGWEIIKHL